MISGFKEVFIDYDGDANLANGFFLKYVGEDTQYDGPMAKKMLSTGENMNTFTDHKFKIVCYDKDRFSTLETWAKDGKKFIVIAYGDSSVQWREPVYGAVTKKHQGAVDVVALELELSFKGVTPLILAAKNLLPPEMRIGENLPTGIAFEVTGMNTFTSVAKSGGNTLASGNVHRLNPNQGGGDVMLPWKFPVKFGMPFSTYSILYNQAGGAYPPGGGLYVKQYDNSGSLVDEFNIIQSLINVSGIFDDGAFLNDGDASVKYFKFGFITPFTVAGYASTEIDNVGLYYGGADGVIVPFINE